MLDDFDNEVLDEFKKEFEKAISRVEKKLNLDLAYWGIKVEITPYYEDFQKREPITIINTHEKNYCNFCGKETYFFDRERHMHLCASCWAQIEKTKEEER
jgi:hypothetical protein